MGEVKPEPNSAGEVKPEPISTGEVKPEPFKHGEARIAITGANGFVGRACVAEARKRHLPVIALYRSSSCPEWSDDAGVTPVQTDLGADPEALIKALSGASAVIHAAAHLGDDPARILRDTIDATRNTVAACRFARARLVLISSIAVYDTDRLSPGDTLTEASPLIPLPQDALADPANALRHARDAYAGSKRLQEALLDQVTAPDTWVLRPGAVWGPARSWHALQGFWASKLFVTIASDGELPLCHVDHLARTAVGCAQRAPDGACVLNVFDDDKPTRGRFLRAHRRIFGWPRLNLSVPYGLWLTLARLLRPLAPRLPGLFREPVLRARMMPLRYANTARLSALPSEDIDTFEGMMARAAEAKR